MEVTTEQQMEQIENAELATSTDASPTDAQTVDTDVLMELHTINATITFWMLLWLVFNMLSRFKSNFLKSTDRME